jgi:hypothetical protein
MKLITALVLALLVAINLPIDTARSQGVAAADAQEFQRIISAQIDAFREDDGPSAYSYAAPLIHKAFPTSDVFMEMVRKGYAPVYRPRSFAFGEVTSEMNNRPTQRVTIIDANGKAWIALYAFEKQPDGTWKIIGCSLEESQGGEA